MAGVVESSARSSEWRPRRTAAALDGGAGGYAWSIEANRRAVAGLVASVYGRERIAEALRAVAEDALYPSGRDGSIHPGVATSSEALRQALDELAENTTARLVERLTRTVEPVGSGSRSGDHPAYDPR